MDDAAPRAKALPLTVSDPTAAAEAALAGAAPPLTHDQRRSRRRREVRAKTISVKRMTKRELEEGRAQARFEQRMGITLPERPRTRAECAGGERPCPFVSCQHHLFLDVAAKTGAIKLNFPDLEVWEMTESCALDVADEGGKKLEEVGAVLNLTRERVRQIEVQGLAKLAALRDMIALRDYVEPGPLGKRRLPLAPRELLEDDPDVASGKATVDALVDGEDSFEGEGADDGGDFDVDVFVALEDLEEP